MNDKAFIHAIFASYQKGLRADLDRGLIDKRAYYARLNKQRGDKGQPYFDCWLISNSIPLQGLGFYLLT